MAQFYVRAYKNNCTWIVDVCNKDNVRSRNSSPSFFPTWYEAKKYAKEYSIKTGIPLKP